MRVSVQMFAVARQLAGANVVELEVSDNATVADLRAALAAENAALAGILGSVRFAIDNQYASDGTPIRPGASVACIPPVSGG